MYPRPDTREKQKVTITHAEQGSGAQFDASGRYRYLLWRTVSARRAGAVLWIMLNPSTADAERNDPTIRRVLGLSRRWRVGTVEVVNLFAFRATTPAELKRAAEPVGPHNDTAIDEALARAEKVVCAWGAEPFAQQRAAAVVERIRRAGHVAACFGHTASGAPRHPLYLPQRSRLRPFRLGGERVLLEPHCRTT